MSAPASQSVSLPGGFAPNTTLVRGEGSPVVFLHGPFGQEWSGFLNDVAARHTVFAPAHPGAVEPNDLHQLDNLWDLMLYYDDVLAALGLDQVDLIGHSFGGMVAAELAASFPQRVGKLVLIDALGLWRDDAPVSDHVMVPPETQVELLYHDPNTPEVAARLRLPEDPDKKVDALVHSVSAVASTSHFIWPIPDRGLAKRLRRVKAKTLIVWGKQDRLVPVVYADEFASRIADARVRLIDNAGHVPYVERQTQVSQLVNDFLATG